MASPPDHHSHGLESTPDIALRSRQLKRASYASVGTALTLITAKFVAWLLTGSVSMMASLADSIMDSLASLINLLAIRYSLQPPDTEHRFGHGKAEPLAGLAQAAFISGSAGFLLLHAFERIRQPYELRSPGIALAVMVFAIALTLVLLLYQRRVIAQTGSTAIQADALHYASDLLSNLGIIAALLLAGLGVRWADPVFAIAVALYIGYSAFKVGREAIQQLMDRELPSDTQQQIVAIALRNPQVQGVHDLRTRQSGQVTFIQLHLEMDGELTLHQAIAVTRAVERDLSDAIPEAQIILHQEPSPAPMP